MKYQIIIRKHRGREAVMDFLKVHTIGDLEGWKRKYPEFVFSSKKERKK